MNVKSWFAEAWRILWGRKALGLIPLIAFVPVLAVMPLLVVYPLPWLGLPAVIESTLLVGAPMALAAAAAETLLVAGVRRERRGNPGGGLGQTLRRCWRAAAAILVVGTLLGTVTGIAFQLPGWLLAAGMSPLAVAAIVLVLLIPFAAFEVTRIAWVSFAVRHAVLEEVGPAVAMIRAWRFLHGRLRLALKLYVATSLLRLAGGMVTGLFVIVLMVATTAAALGGGASGPIWVPLVIGFGLSLPLLCVVQAFSSALWTLSFLDERALR